MMRKVMIILIGIVLGLSMYLAILNRSFIATIINPKNHYLSHFENQFYFDNGKEIWVEELKIF